MTKPFHYFRRKVQSMRLNKLIGFLFLCTVWACSPTRTLNEGEYLLVKNQVKVENSSVNTGDANNYIRQEPNKKTLGIYRLYLQLYLKKEDANGKLKNWLERIGEPPVVYDSLQAATSASQIEKYFQSRGYFYAECGYEAKRGFLRRKKTRNVVYTIHPGPGYTYRNITFRAESAPIQSLLPSLKEDCLFQENDHYNAETMNKERQRIQASLKGSGYYFFSKEFVYFQVDTTIGNHQADVVINIQDRRVRGKDTVITKEHKPYKISTIYIEADYNPRKTRNQAPDTLLLKGYTILYYDSLEVDPQGLIDAVRYQEDEWYTTFKVDQTYNHFSSLRYFRTINLRFSEDTLTDRARLVSRIQLSPMKRRSYGIETELTHEVGNFGINGRIIYRDRNIFGGMEQFDISLSGAIETQNNLIQGSPEIFNSREMGIESNLRIPRFLLPFNTEGMFSKRVRPFTNIKLRYQKETRKEFTRSASSGAFGYIWNENAWETHLFNPINITSVSLEEKSNFEISSNPFLANAFRNQLITSLTYSYIFNNQGKRDRKNEDFYRFFKGDLELSGSTLHMFRSSLKQNDDGNYTVAGLPYSHFIKIDLDQRIYFNVGPQQQLAFRGFAGWGHVFENSSVLPLDKQYFAGGSTDNRAFTAYRLGPGAYDSDSIQFNTADIKLGVFAEYRFPIAGNFLGATFVDAGNIWTGNREDAPEDAKFHRNKFYKQLGLGAGLGLRYDFSFFIIRLDLATPLHDPGREIQPWVIKDFRLNQIKLNIGLGYPF